MPLIAVVAVAHLGKAVVCPLDRRIGTPPDEKLILLRDQQISRRRIDRNALAASPLDTRAQDPRTTQRRTRTPRKTRARTHEN